MRFIFEKGSKLLTNLINFGESKVIAEDGHHISVKSMPDSERGTEVIAEDKIINEDFVLTEILRASKITLSDKVTFSGIDGTFLLLELVEGDIFEESRTAVAGGGGAALDSLSLLGIEPS